MRIKTHSSKRVWRILKRYFKRKKDKSFEEKFLEQFSLIKYSLSHNSNKRTTGLTEIQKFIKKNKIDTIIFRNNKDVNKFLENIK